MKNHTRFSDGSSGASPAHRRLLSVPGRCLSGTAALAFLFSGLSMAQTGTTSPEVLPATQQVTGKEAGAEKAAPWQHFEARLVALEKKLAAAELSGRADCPAGTLPPDDGDAPLSPDTPPGITDVGATDSTPGAGLLPLTPATVIPPATPQRDTAVAPVTPVTPVAPVTPVTPSEVATEKTPVAADAPALPPLSEQEQDSYVVGMMVADYARSVLQTLGKLDISLDEALLTEGIQNTLAGRPRLDERTAQTAMQRFQQETDRRQAEKDVASRQLLSTLAGKHDTLEKKDDRLWVRLKKGGPAVSRKTPLRLSREGAFYNGGVFETVKDTRVTRREALPAWQQQAIRLAGPGGQVRLYILAGSLEGEADLPAGTARHELVQYTVSVDKE